MIDFKEKVLEVTVEASGNKLTKITPKETTVTVDKGTLLEFAFNRKANGISVHDDIFIIMKNEKGTIKTPKTAFHVLKRLGQRLLVSGNSTLILTNGKEDVQGTINVKVTEKVALNLPEEGLVEGTVGPVAIPGTQA